MLRPREGQTYGRIMVCKGESAPFSNYVDLGALSIKCDGLSVIS